MHKAQQDRLISEMKSCPQNDYQTIYDHGVSVQEHFIKLYTNNLEGFKIPNWLIQYKNSIHEKLMAYETCMEYTLFHDCGKPRCLTIDSEGKRHFHCHAKVSSDLWRSLNGSEDVARLIEMDMDIHTLKSKNIKEFASRKEAITLLMSGLAEIHSNAKMFGGIDSTSFKIKWKQIDKKGQNICDIIFK